MAYAFMNQYYIDADNAELVRILEKSARDFKVPFGVKRIGTNAFLNHSALKSIYIPESVESIAKSAFGYTNISELILPNSCHTLENDALSNMTAVKKIKLGNVKSIGNRAFVGQSQCLQYDFTRCDSVPTVTSDAFDSTLLAKNKPFILVPRSLYETWIASTNWAGYADYIRAVTEAPTVETPSYVSEGLLIENGVLKGRGECGDSVIVVPESVESVAWEFLANDSLIDTLILPEKGILIEGGLGKNSTLRVIKNYFNMYSSFGLSEADNLSIISVIGSNAINNYQFYGLPAGIDIDFSRCESVPTLSSPEFISVGEGTRIFVPLALYDEWIKAENWSALSQYIFAAHPDPVKTEDAPGEMEDGVYKEYCTGLEDGKSLIYDGFWDEYQQKGERTHYAYAFAGAGWRKNTFKPKYPLDKVTTGIYMFNCFGFNDYSNFKFNLKQALEDMGIAFDTSNVSDFTHMFANAFIGTVPALDLSKAKTLTTFLGQSQVHTVDKLIVHSDLKYNNAFAGAPNLENITIEGTIGQSGLNMQYCTKLSKASIESIIAACSVEPDENGVIPDYSMTFSLVAVNKAFETSEGANDGSTSAEWYEAWSSRMNWTFSLV